MEGNIKVDNLIKDLILLLNDNSFNCNKKIEHKVKSISSFFDTDHSKSEQDLVFSLLFRPEKSLLYFIEKALPNKSLISGVKEALSLVLTLFYKFEKDLSQYVVQIKDVCYVCVRDSTSADIQDKAYQIIIAVVSSKVQLPPDADININGLFTFLFNEKLTKKKSLSPTVVGSVYELFGAIAQNYPANCSEKIKPLVRNVLEELKKQIIITKEVKPPIIRGCMLALKGILVHFTKDWNEEPEDSKEIYKYIKSVCTFQDHISRKMFQRAALELLATEGHLKQLWGWALEDYRWWLQELPIWANQNRENKYAGEKALRAFHKECWDHLLGSKGTPTEKTMAIVSNALRIY